MLESCFAEQRKTRGGILTIAVEIDFCKENISDFSDLAKAAFEYSLSFGRELVRRIIEERDAELREERDKARYVKTRASGKRA